LRSLEKHLSNPSPQLVAKLRTLGLKPAQLGDELW